MARRRGGVLIRSTGAQYAQRLGRGPVVVRTGSRTVSVKGGQAARLVEAKTRAKSSIARVREIDPTWRPTPSAYESVEGLIRAHNAVAREAHVGQMSWRAVGSGPVLLRESIEARSPNADFRAAERQEINRIGGSFGCHTCGPFDPGTLSRISSRTTNRRRRGIRSIDSNVCIPSVAGVAAFRAVT